MLKGTSIEVSFHFIYKILLLTYLWFFYIHRIQQYCSSIYVALLSVMCKGKRLFIFILLASLQSEPLYKQQLSVCKSITTSTRYFFSFLSLFKASAPIIPSKFYTQIIFSQSRMSQIESQHRYIYEQDQERMVKQIKVEC